MKAATAARLLLLASLWGASFLFIKVSVQGMHPTVMAFGRIAIGAIVVAAWAAARRSPVPRSGRVWAKLAFLAVFGNMIPFTLFGLAEQSISSALASVLNATTPLMTAVAAVALLRTETMSPHRAIGILIGFGGVATIVIPGAGLGGGTVAGSLAVIAATASYGITGAFARRYLSGPPVGNAAGQLLIASVGMAAVASVAARGAPFTLSFQRALALLALGALGTGIGWVMYLGLIADEGATTASLVTYLVPFISVVIGRVVLGETLRWNTYLGGAIVVIGIAVTEGRLGKADTIAALP